jgi:predicted transcriptional regulator
MGVISVRLPDDLKDKAMKLAKKQNISFNSLVNYWLQAAVMQDETLEWMKRQLGGKKPADLIADFGAFLEKRESGDEPTLDDIQQAMRE